MLFTGAAAAGWRVIEAFRGSARKSQWRYHSPVGKTYTQKSSALEAAGKMPPPPSVTHAPRYTAAGAAAAAPIAPGGAPSGVVAVVQGYQRGPPNPLFPPVYTPLVAAPPQWPSPIAALSANAAAASKVSARLFDPNAPEPEPEPPPTTTTPTATTMMTATATAPSSARARGGGGGRSGRASSGRAGRRQTDGEGAGPAAPASMASARDAASGAAAFAAMRKNGGLGLGLGAALGPGGGRESGGRGSGGRGGGGRGGGASSKGQGKRKATSQWEQLQPRKKQARVWDARAGGWRNEIDEVLEGELLHAAEVGADGYDGLAGGGAFGGAFGGAEDGLGAEDEDEEDSDLEKDEDFRTYGLADADEPPNLSTFQQAAMDITGISGPGACGDSDDDDGDGVGAAGSGAGVGHAADSFMRILSGSGAAAAGGKRGGREAPPVVRREPSALEVSAAARLYGRPGRLTSLRDPDIIGGGSSKDRAAAAAAALALAPHGGRPLSPIHGALRRRRRAGEALDEAAMAAGGGRPAGAAAVGAAVGARTDAASRARRGAWRWARRRRRVHGPAR